MHLLFDVTSRHRRPVSCASTGCLSLATSNIMLHPKLYILHRCYTLTESGPKNIPRPNRSDVGPEWTWSSSRTWTCSDTSNIHTTWIIYISLPRQHHDLLLMLMLLFSSVCISDAAADWQSSDTASRSHQTGVPAFLSTAQYCVSFVALKLWCLMTLTPSPPIDNIWAMIFVWR